MAEYTGREWKDHLEDTAGQVIQEGTPLSAKNLNEMEQGIKQANVTAGAAQKAVQETGAEITNIKKDIGTVTTQLADTTSVVKRHTTYVTDKKRPIISFIDDDGASEVITKLKPLYDSKGIKGSSAIITGRVGLPGFMNESEIRTVYDDGWEILGHTVDHATNLGIYPIDSDLEYQIQECNAWLNRKGFKNIGFVYPQNYSDARIRKMTKKYYTYAFGKYGINQGSPIDTTFISRISFSNFTASNPTINGNSEKNTLAYYKACVDYAIANNAWLVFTTHIAQMPESDLLVLGQLIDYINSRPIDVVSTQTGYEMFGNNVFFGDMEEEFVAIDDKGIHSNTVMRSKELKFNSKIPNDPITSYDKGISRLLITGPFATANGFPTTVGGEFVTYYTQGDWNFSRQEYLVSKSNQRFVRFPTSATAWSPWVDSDTYNTVIGTYNKYSSTSLLTEYPTGKIYIHTVGGANAAGFPDNASGIVTTYRIGGNGYDRQEFRKNGTNELWVRYVKTDGTWADFSIFASGKRGSAIPNTTGADLASVEAEVNKLKAVLKNFNMIS